MQAIDNAGIFIYRQSPLLDRSWMIYLKREDGDLTPVGDYTVLDQDETLEISEKKLMNLVTLFNDGDELIHFGEQTKARILFHIKPKQDHLDPTQVVFYTYTGNGVSRENAILTLEAGVA